MKSPNVHTLSVAAATALLMTIASAASAAPLFFSSPDFVWFHPSGGATPSHIWVAGDYWEQTFSGTGLNSSAALDLDIFIDDNILFSGDAVNLDVLLNGLTVGNFSVGSGVTGLLSESFTYAPVAALAGQSFDIKMLETNTIDPGHGSISMGVDRQSFASLHETAPVPETNTMALVGFGALALAGFGLRRRS